MVAIVMAVAPRASSISSAAAALGGCRRLTMALVRSHRLCPVAFSISRRTYVPGSRNLAARIPVPEWRGHRERPYTRAAAVEESPEITKSKRLSREERTALVESFVRKHMAEKAGEFPPIALVLKETGGSRPVVKEILAEIQTKVETKSKEETAASSKITEFKNKVDEVRVEATVTKEPETSREAEKVSTIVSASSDEDTEQESEEEPDSTAENKPAEKITTLRRMTGETPGEINTYGDILNRLRSLGSPDSARKKEEPPAESPLENDEKTPPPETQRRTNFAARILPPRHGMFVRFLHPSATEEDLKNAFGDCGEISRVSAVKPMKPTAKFTYGFIDFKTAEGLSSALRKSVMIRGHKVETEAAPTQNSSATLPDVVIPKLKDTQGGGSTLIDNLVSKVVSMVPENGNSMKGPGKPWNGPDTKFNRGGNMMQNNKGEDFKGTAQDTRFRPGIQRNDMPQRNEMPPRHDQRNDFHVRNEAQQMQFQQGPPVNDVVPPPSPNGVAVSPNPQFSDPQKLRRQLAVSVDNVAANVNVQIIKEALSIHGEVVATYLKHQNVSGSSYFFEYLSEDAKENALTAHWLYINGQQLKITRADMPKTTVVRVTNISPSTPDSEFINACKSCGQVEKVESRRDRVRDVFFHGSEMRNMPRILDRMNEITLNQCKWHARPAPRCTQAVVNSPEGQEWLCQQLKQLLKNQESMLVQMQIEHRDMRELTMHVVEALGSPPPQSRRP